MNTKAQKLKALYHTTVRPAFGMKVIHVGSVCVYTIKIRFSRSSFYALRNGAEPIPGQLVTLSEDGKYVTITHESADLLVASEMMKKVGLLCREIAFTKLHKKYEWVTRQNPAMP